MNIIETEFHFCWWIFALPLNGESSYSCNVRWGQYDRWAFFLLLVKSVFYTLCISPMLSLSFWPSTKLYIRLFMPLTISLIFTRLLWLYPFCVERIRSELSNEDSEYAIIWCEGHYIILSTILFSLILVLIFYEFLSTECRALSCSLLYSVLSAGWVLTEVVPDNWEPTYMFDYSRFF